MSNAVKALGMETSTSPMMVQDFVLQTLRLVEAVVDSVDWGVYDVLLPQENMRRVTFDVEVAQERNDCELVTFGSPFFESMVQLSRQYGRIQVRRIAIPVAGPPNHSDERLSSLAHFVKCKPPRAVSWRVEEGLLLLCRFHVTYQADDIVEDMISVLVDVDSLAEVTDLLPQLDSHWFTTGTHSEIPAEEDGRRMAGPDSPTSLSLLPLASPHSIREVLARAASAALPNIEKGMRRIETEYQAQLNDELEKSRYYYETTLQTLRRQLENTLDTGRGERLRLKIEATERELTLRMEDIQRAYEVSTEVLLDQCILYRAPVIDVQTEIQQRTDKLPFSFRYYPWAKQWAPISCPVCHKNTTQLQRHGPDWHCGCVD